MRHSMTGFAARAGGAGDHDWTWDLRGVNAKGLDLRLRLPDWAQALESALRKAVTERLGRGTVQVSLRAGAVQAGGAVRVDPASLKAALAALAEAEQQAAVAGVALAPSTAAEIAGLRGVLSAEPPAPDLDAMRDAMLADFDAALSAFCTMRADEGARLAALVTGQLDTIAGLVREAREAAANREADIRDRLRTQLARVLDSADGMDPDRLTQEMAIIAMRGDVTEELDRLDVHVAAARALLDEPAPVGRRLDFLCQEFMREANTLCSKSGDNRLTTVGLALKAAIEQMREQIQNLE